MAIRLKMSKKDQKELALSKIFLIFLALAALGFVVWLAWMRPAKESADITNFEECVAAGNPVQLSFPEACVAPDGQRFVKPH